MEAIQKEREMVEAVEAQATEKGSHVIVKTNGPALLRSIEMTETAVTAMTAEIARNKMKDTDVVEMHTEIGKSQRKNGGRPAGSPALSAGKREKTIASETAVGTETAARGRTGVRDGPGRTTDPGKTKTGKIVDPAVAMKKATTPEASGANALITERKPDRVAKIAAPTTDQPERTEEGETAVGPLLKIGDKSALLIVTSPGRTTVQRPDVTQDLPRHQTAQGTPQSRKQCQQQWERWSKISELLRHLRAGGAVEHLESFIHRGNMKNQHDRFHKPGSRTKDLPSFGNWNLSFFAFLLAGEVIGPQETSKEATYGAAIEGWISVLHDEEEDDLIRELLDSVIEGLTVVMELFEQTPSQLHDVVHWKTNEPDFDRVMRHFYPREIPKGMEPKSALGPEWEDRREQPQGSRSPDPEVEWTEDEEWRKTGSPLTERTRRPRRRPRRPQHPRTSNRRSRTIRSTLRPSASTRTGSRGLRQLVGRLPVLPKQSVNSVLPLIVLITHQENWSTSTIPRFPNDSQSC